MPSLHFALIKGCQSNHVQMAAMTTTEAYYNGRTLKFHDSMYDLL